MGRKTAKDGGCSSGTLGAAATLLVLSALLSGCFTHHGMLERSREVNDLFLENRILPDHRYYYTGPEAAPHALLGLDKEYVLDSRLWVETAPSSRTLRDWVLRMGLYRGFGGGPYGSYILDPTGKRVGVWYSNWDSTIVRVEGGNRIVIHPPNRLQAPSWMLDN